MDQLRGEFVGIVAADRNRISTGARTHEKQGEGCGRSSRPTATSQIHTVYASTKAEREPFRNGAIAIPTRPVAAFVDVDVPRLPQRLPSLAAVPGR
jgi:hypothetical protein